MRHGFSTRAGGVSTVYGGADLNLGFTKDDDRALVEENRRRLVVETGGGSLMTMRQIHSSLSRRVDDAGDPVCEGDGLMTNVSGLLLGVLTADCVPVLVVDTAKRVVAGFHAGWRGTVARIVEQGVARMTAEYGSKPEDLIAAVGPAIGVCCYEVGEEVRERFGTEFDYAAELFTPERHVDLAEANRRQLLAAGLPPGAVHVVGECTVCTLVDGRRKYFSHRAEHGFTGRMMSVVGVVEQE
ncbi:peptidoglycan editing factor PgeF [Granulicella rosea]|uniref:peptidoglycan editing factor PgeF n=1 Tax=Granulicella rosea TaxID=474952 RepID=UPI001FE99F04|nr:peptidoglycan editing factor PgeF [Granulicella rosea]